MKRVLALLIRTFPRPFRERFGPELLQHVERDYERARTRGVLAGVSHALLAAFDLVQSSIAERANPVWVNLAVPSERKRSMSWSEWSNDLRQSARGLRRTPGFVAMTVGTLGLAIGANAGMFSIVNKVLLDPLPYPAADRLVWIAATAPGSDFPEEFGVGSEFYVHYSERSRLLEDVAVVNSFTSTLRVGDRAERVPMSWPTNSLFTTLGARPILGRLPVDEDEENAVVISHALWQSWFGGDPSAIGQTHFVSGSQRTIIGVMGPEFRYPSDGTLLWISSTIKAADITRPGNFGSGLIARMAPGATIDGVQSELTGLARELPDRFGGTAAYARVIGQHRAVVRSIQEQLFGAVSRPLWVLLGATAIVLLIACANVANLFLVRSEIRHRDLAVRRAVGATRPQLIRYQLSEAVIVALLAGVVAVVLAAITLPAVLRAAPPEIPRLDQVGIGASTLVFTLVVAIVATIACGMVPALRASAPSLMRLREGGRGSTGRRRYGRDLLVATQTALALVLLIGSALLLRSLNGLKNVDPGYDTENIFTFQFAPERAELIDGPTWAAFHREFLGRLATLPGVESVGFVENVPLNEGTPGFRMAPDGRSVDDGSLIDVTFTAGDYFPTMGIALREGRLLEDADHRGGEVNVVISTTAANLLYPDESAVGRRIHFQLQGRGIQLTVVGVVDDVMQNSFRDPPQPLVYLPMVGPEPNTWSVGTPAYVLKTARAETIAPKVRALVREVAPEAPMYRVFTMAGLARDSMLPLSFTMLTLGIAAGLALVLGIVGLYGVLSYIVAQRTREIGVRMALGARAQQVRAMVVAQGARVVGAGIVVGILVALASTRALGSLLYNVAPVHIATFATMSACMLGVGLLASYVPARRASNVDPNESLRSD